VNGNLAYGRCDQPPRLQTSNDRLLKQSRKPRYHWVSAKRRPFFRPSHRVTSLHVMGPRSAKVCAETNTSAKMEKISSMPVGVLIVNLQASQASHTTRRLPNQSKFGSPFLQACTGKRDAETFDEAKRTSRSPDRSSCCCTNGTTPQRYAPLNFRHHSARYTCRSASILRGDGPSNCQW